MTVDDQGAPLETEDDVLARAQANEAESVAKGHRQPADARGRLITEAHFRRISRRSLLTGAGGALAGFVGWRVLQARPDDGRIPDVLRQGHELNERVWSGLFRDGAMAPTFDFAESSELRVNGRHGIRTDLDVATWQLDVRGTDGELLGTHTLSELRGLRQREMTVEHKCVEGWSHVVTWGGIRFADFAERFYPEQSQAAYVGLATPDNAYRVGLDRESMMHPQTMLTLDLQREPLSELHGAPVRLTTPLKYGIKQIKRIGTIEFSDTQPEDDYWATRGYDWYAAL